jgi:hypothetical protein
VGLIFAPVACGSDHGTTAPTPKPAASSPGTESGATTFADAPTSSQRAELTLDDFELAPGAETYKCQNFKNPFGRDVALLQTQSIMSHGSHHLAVFRYDQNADGSLEGCSGLEFHATIHAAQTPVAKTRFPDGVGAFLSGSEGVRLNAHYLNLTEETIHAKVTVALDAVDPGEVPNIAAQIYLNDSTLDIPPGMGEGGGTISLPPEVTGVKLLSAQSHMHRRGMGFRAMLEDGTTIYESSTWSEPPTKTYDPPIALADGAKLSWKCQFQNDTGGHLIFGESADTNEMCVLTGFYYPAPGGPMIVGDLSGGTVGSLFK